jgi:hypothetical protein
MSPDNQLLQWMTTATVRKLRYDPTQVFPAIAPDYDPAWKGNPIIEWIPGEKSPFGGGNGAQEGGAMLTQQIITGTVFYRCRLDTYSRSTELLIEANKGLLDIFASIRALFALTCFPINGDPTASQYLLWRPMQWMGESATVWEDAENYVARRDIRFQAVYGVSLPSEPTILFTDYT